MNHHLVIRIKQPALQADTSLAWFLFDQTHQLLDSGHLPVSDIFAAVSIADKKQLSIHVIVPNDTVLLTTVNIPSQNARQIKQALPFAIEELICEELENVHMAIPQLQNIQGNEIDVAVIKHSYLIHWLDVLCHANLNPDSMVVDSLCVPYTESCSLLLNDGHLNIRFANYKGLCCQPEDFASLYSSIVKDETDDHTIELVCCADSTQLDAVYLPAMVELYYKESVDEVLATTALKQLPLQLNLLQGGYRQNSESGSALTIWKLPLAVAAASVAIGFYFNQQADTLFDESVSYYKKLFPNERRVVSPKRQLQNHLRLVATGESGVFLNALSNISGEIKQFTVESKIIVNQLSFNESANSIKFELTSQNIEQLDQLKQQLVAVGMNAAIGSARVQDNGVVSQMTVELN